METKKPIKPIKRTLAHRLKQVEEAIGRRAGISDDQHQVNLGVDERIKELESDRTYACSQVKVLAEKYSELSDQLGRFDQRLQQLKFATDQIAAEQANAQGGTYKRSIQHDQGFRINADAQRKQKLLQIRDLIDALMHP